MNKQKELYFEFQLHRGYVTFDIWIQLARYSILLYIKRILRFCKRMLKYLKNYIPIMLCVIIFELIIIPLGIHLEKYTSWIDGIWDLRNFMLTSLIISIVVGIFSTEKKRHRELKRQYWVYETFKYSSESFIRSLCEVADISIEGNLFLSEENFDLFYLQLEKTIKKDLPVIKNLIIMDKHLLYSTKELPRKIAIKIYFDRYLRELDNLNRALLSHDFEGTIEHAIDQVDYIYNEIKAECLLIEDQRTSYTDKQLLKFVDSISRTIYPAIADIRRPWRWDIELNNKMRELMKVNDS